MLPARNVTPRVLESDSGPLDPLHVAMEAFVSAPDAQRWRIVSQVALSAVDDRPAGTLSILLVGNPLVGILLCIDRGSFRECKRLRPDGAHVCSISGQRQGPPLTPETSGKNQIDWAFEATNRVLDRIGGEQ